MVENCTQLNLKILHLNNPMQKNWNNAKTIMYPAKRLADENTKMSLYNTIMVRMSNSYGERAFHHKRKSW